MSVSTNEWIKKRFKYFKNIKLSKTFSTKEITLFNLNNLKKICNNSLPCFKAIFGTNSKHV